LEVSDEAWPEEPVLDTKLFKEHATTDSPRESVGRWKRELSTSQQDLCAAAFANFLTQFGYDESASSSKTVTSVQHSSP
jgi:hypothetical protein